MKNLSVKLPKMLEFFLINLKTFKPTPKVKVLSSAPSSSSSSSFSSSLSDTPALSNPPSPPAVVSPLSLPISIVPLSDSSPSPSHPPVPSPLPSASSSSPLSLPITTNAPPQVVPSSQAVSSAVSSQAAPSQPSIVSQSTVPVTQSPKYKLIFGGFGMSWNEEASGQEKIISLIWRYQDAAYGNSVHQPPCLHALRLNKKIIDPEETVDSVLSREKTNILVLRVDPVFEEGFGIR